MWSQHSLSPPGHSRIQSHRLCSFLAFRDWHFSAKGTMCFNQIHNGCIAKHAIQVHMLVFIGYNINTCSPIQLTGLCHFCCFSISSPSLVWWMIRQKDMFGTCHPTDYASFEGATQNTFFPFCWIFLDETYFDVDNQCTC